MTSSPDCGMSAEVTGFEGLVKYALFVSANAIVVIHPVSLCQQNEGALLMFYIKVQSALLNAFTQATDVTQGYFSSLLLLGIAQDFIRRKSTHRCNTGLMWLSSSALHHSDFTRSTVFR